MSFDLVAYDRLKTSVYNSIKSLIQSYNPKCKVKHDTIDDAISEIPTLERQVQARVLLRTVDLLKNSTDESEQARVLNAMVYFIREQIGAKYKHTSPEGSTLYCSLTTSLGINKENEPSRNELLDMYRSLESFLCDQVYVESDARKGYSESQPFAIEGYSVENDIKDIIEKRNALKIEVIDAAKKLYLQQHKPAKSKGGFMGIFSSSSSSSSSKHNKEKADSEYKTSLT